jgi:hypothetical protein
MYYFRGPIVCEITVVTGTSGPVGPTRGLEAAGRSVTDIWFFIRLLSNIDVDVFCVFFCVILLLATGGWTHRAWPTHLGCHAHAGQQAAELPLGLPWHVRKTEITWLPENNFKPHLIPLYWSSGIGPRGAIFLIRAALSSIIVQCTLMKKKIKGKKYSRGKSR